MLPIKTFKCIFAVRHVSNNKLYYVGRQALLCFASNLGMWKWKWIKSKNVTRWTFPLQLRPKKTNSRCEQHQETQISPGLVPPPCVAFLWLQAQKGGHFEITVGGEWIVRWGCLLPLPTLSGWWSPLCTKTPLALSSINGEGVRTFLSSFNVPG